MAGWVYSNDVEKKARWDQTIAWIEKWKLEALFDDLTPEMMYSVENPTTHEIGPMGGPLYLPWNFASLPKITARGAESAIKRLQADWSAIAGVDLSKITRPLMLTGKKRRRLLAWADNKTLPPWGNWNCLQVGETRRAFTVFRCAVNNAIAPMAVDHIDFTFAELNR